MSILHLQHYKSKKTKIMKTNKNKKTDKKFDLEKMKVAKLRNIHLINGGGISITIFKTIKETHII
jgi:hypothetical protein